MVEPLPEPLVPADVDVDRLPGFILDVDRLFSSELYALASGDEFRAAVSLWARAWKQHPAGSLPDDDAILAAFSGAGPRWRKVKAMALRGFVKCSDGRLYHRVLCEDVLRAAQAKQDRRDRTAAATEARKRKRDDGRNDGGDGAPPQRNDPPPSNVTMSQGRDGTVTESEPALPSLEAVGQRACELAGIDPGRMAVDFTEVRKWLAAGYDLARDIDPTIRAIASRPGYKPPGSLRYFTKAIGEAHEAGKDPLPQFLRRVKPDGAGVVPTRSANPKVGSPEWAEQQRAMGLEP